MVNDVGMIFEEGLDLNTNSRPNLLVFPKLLDRTSGITHPTNGVCIGFTATSRFFAFQPNGSVNLSSKIVFR